MAKINKIAGAVTQAVEVVVKKGSKAPEKPMTDYEKFYEAQKLLSESTTSQGKALVKLNKKDIKQEVITEGLAKTRKVVKAMPLPKSVKIQTLDGINSKIENRYIMQNLSGKSARESAEVVLEQKPVDLEAKKAELLAKHGEKYELKKQQEAEELCRARQEYALKSVIRNLRQDFIADTREFVSVFAFIEKKIPEAQLKEFINMDGYNVFWKILYELKNKSKNMTEFTYKAAEYIGKVFTDKGLLFAKEMIAEIPSDEVSPRIKSQFLSIINGEIESRITTKDVANRSVEEIKEVFLNTDEKELGVYQADLAEQLTKRKNVLMMQFKEQFENRPGRKSAKAIQELNPKDLGAMKIELEKKFGNVSIIKSYMLEKDIDYAQARKLAIDEIENYSKLYRVSLEEAENKFERRAQAVIELYRQIGKTITL